MVGIPGTRGNGRDAAGLAVAGDRIFVGQRGLPPRGNGATMTHTTTRTALTLLAVAITALASTTAAFAAPSGQSALAPDGPAIPRISWTACGGDTDPAAQCGTASVPLDYDSPGAGSVAVALAKVAAADPQQKIGTVFVNPGGPGGSGVAMVQYGFGSYLGELLGGRFDVVGFDPRGVGRTEPIQCFDSNDEAIEFLTAQPVFPYRADQYRPYFDHWRGYATRCADRDQRITAHMSTADVARDLDLLRLAVGDQRLTYLGFSYGSYIGNTYAKLFGRNVGRMVIDGVLDPQLWSSGWQIRSDRVAAQQVLDQFHVLCDEAGSACAFHTDEGSASRWERLAKALRAEPVDLGDGFRYGYDFLIADMTGMLYAPEIWGGPDGAAAFFDLVADAALGEPVPETSAIADTRRALLDRLGAHTAADLEDEPYFFNGLDAFHGNHCADAEYPSAFAQWLAVDRYAAAGSRFGPLWWWGTAGCAEWPVSADRYTGPWPARTANPVLVVGNLYDPSTAYTGAQASARFLRGSRLLTYAGWGHTAFGRSECVTQAVVVYLRSGALPEAGTTCPANPNPFELSVARSVAPAPLVGLPAPWQLAATAR